MEEIQTRDGLITNASFTDYLIPTTLDMPPVETVLIEEPEPDARLRRRRASASRRPSSRPRRSSPRFATATGPELPRAPVRLDEIVGLGLTRTPSSGCRRRRRLLADDDRDRGDDDRRSDQDLHCQMLVAEQHAEQIATIGLTYAYVETVAERRVREQPRVRRVADDRADRDEVDPGE